MDEITRARIVEGQYIDFVKLLPRDRVIDDDDKRMQMVNEMDRAIGYL